MSKGKIKQDFSIDPVIKSLRDRNVESFADWLIKDCDQVAGIAKIHGNHISAIAKIMEWPEPRRFCASVSTFLRILSKKELEAVIKANLNAEKKLHPFLAQKLNKLGFQDLVAKVTGRKRLPEWHKMSDEEVAEYIRKEKYKRLAELSLGLSNHLRRPDNAELYIIVADMFLPYARTEQARAALRDGIKKREGGIKKDPILARQALDRFKNEFHPTLKIWSPINHRIYCRCAIHKGALMFREYFQMIACIFAGAFEKDGYEKQRSDFYYLTEKELKAIIDSFLITQEDLKELPGFFEFLYRRGFEEYVPGTPETLATNLKLMQERRQQARTGV